ncbi:MAG: permease [Desulfofustis sp.]|nr:permease [Desulfofustis sp.]
METIYPQLGESLIFFLTTMAEMAILFVGISFLVGVINEFLPQDKVKRWLSGRHGRGYLVGSILGGLTPFCSCSTIPVTIGLLRAGAGFGPTMAFLFTSPLVNPVIIPLFVTLLGLEITLVYATVAIGMTIVISFLLEKAGFSRFLIEDALQLGIAPAATGTPLSRPVSRSASGDSATQFMVQLQPAATGKGTAGSGPEQQSAFTIPVYQQEQPGTWRRIFNEAVRQFRSLLPYVILGVAIGSVIHGFLPADLVVRLAGADNPLAVPVSAVVGIPLYLRVSTMVPIAASLVAKGMSLGAVIALIIGGAGASLPELAMLKGMFRLPLLIGFIGSVMVMAISAGFLVNFIVL